MFANSLLLLPDFALIFAGAALVRYVRLGEDFWSGAEKLVYYVLFPPLLFTAISNASFALADSTDLVMVGLGGFLGSVLLSLAAAPLLRPPLDLFASAAQTGYRFNSYLGLATAATLAGTRGVAMMALLVALCVPIANVVAVSTLARLRGAGMNGTWRELVTNPLILATVLGLAANLVELRLPAAANDLLGKLSGASLTLGLLCIGAGLRPAREHARSDALIYFVLVKLFAVPTVVLALMYLLPVRLDPFETKVVLLFAALPTASATYILASRMGGNGPAVAFVVTAQILLSMVSLPLWLAVAR